MEKHAEFRKGAAYIACGLAYMPEQMYLATLQQLSQGLPPNVLKLIRECGIVARPRAKKQQMEFLMNKKLEPVIPSQGDAKVQEISDEQAENIKKEESKPIEEPEDVDSIDGDTEEAPAEEESKDEPKVQELEEDEIDEEEQKQEEPAEDVEQPEILPGSQQSSIEIVKPEEIEAVKEEMKQVEQENTEEEIPVK